MHFTNAAGYPPGVEVTPEFKYLRRGRRKSLLQFAERFAPDRWAEFWAILKNSVANAFLSFTHKYSCRNSPHQRRPGRCRRYMNLCAVDIIQDKNLTEARVMEINNNPGGLHVGDGSMWGRGTGPCGGGVHVGEARRGGNNPTYDRRRPACGPIFLIIIHALSMAARDACVQHAGSEAGK